MEARADRDRRIVRAILQGDADAYADLVTRYQSLVASVAWRYGIGAGEIEDVVSEIFFKAYGNLARFRPEHAFSTWLYRVALNHVIDHGRRHQRESKRVEMPREIEDRSAGPDAGVAADERARLLRSALSDLPAHFREVLFLVYVEGKKVDEAAHLLGLPRGTIKTRLMRGRAALRKTLLRRHPGYFEN